MNDTTRLLTRVPVPSDLTIAICTLGRQGYLQTALRSVINTTPPGVRLHIVLNGSDDPTLAHEISTMLSTWDGEFALTELDERLTISGSHNVALAAATTDFITFMGDDDLVLEPRVEQLLHQFWATTPTPAVIGSFSRRVSGSHDAPRFSTNKDYGPTTIAEWKAQRDSDDLIEVVFPSAIYRTELLRSIGGFEERFGSAMDLATFTTLGRDHPVLANPRRSFAHRIHDASVTSGNPAEHAARLQYTQAAMAALRAGQPQPEWETFIADHYSTSAIPRTTRHRRVLSATLFRQGGAAVASGNTIHGIGKVAASAVLSPGTFFQRSKAQVVREEAGQAVVSVLLKNLNQYRLPFFRQLRDVLREDQIELRLITADGMAEDHAKGDRATLPWAEHRAFRELSVRGRTLLWQPGFDVASGADLIITEQATKQLFNFVLAYGQRGLGTRFAFWGHGKNFQASIEGDSGEGLKQRLTQKAHWFFAYNKLSGQAAIEAGMPADRITHVMNATDTDHIRAVLDSLPADSEQSVRRELGMGDGPVVLCMGGMSPLKRPQFIVDAAIALRAQVPDVEVVVVGGGSQQHLVAEAAETHSWLHATGALYGDERIRIAAVAVLQMMPGLVGLNIVDGFALGLPIITTAIDYHSPEIEYLIDGVNGAIAPADATPAEYATYLAAILQDPDRLDALRAGADIAGRELTIDAMVTNFAEGVRAALNAPLR